MGRSLEFCKRVASDPSRSTYADRDWNKALEDIETEAIFDEVLHGERKLNVSGADDNRNKFHFGVELSFDQDADFDYFTSNSCVHDGTLIFIRETMNKCVERVCCARTYNKDIEEPKSGDTIKYTIGNFVILNEYDKRFAPSDKPWMEERTTVLLPLKVEIESGKQK